MRRIGLARFCPRQLFETVRSTSTARTCRARRDTAISRRALQRAWSSTHSHVTSVCGELLLSRWYLLITIRRISVTAELTQSCCHLSTCRIKRQPRRLYTPRVNQGRSDRGISVYIPPPPNSSTLNFLCGCLVSLAQDKLELQWLVNIYTHPNQIPGYAPGVNIVFGQRRQNVRSKT